MRALLAEGVEHVIFDDKDGEISALLLHFTRAPHDAHRASRMLDAFASVALNLPCVITSSERRPADTERALLIAGAILCGVSSRSGSSRHCSGCGNGRDPRARSIAAHAPTCSSTASTAGRPVLDEPHQIIDVIDRSR
ncbi:hypothetical protein [Sorangium sp. So ce128]|uniref:hypothetical protein n=1 Tax=Sorangium sp. So ce128 TaxID=3133281 RepID=UPI003F5DF654